MKNASRWFHYTNPKDTLVKRKVIECNIYRVWLCSVVIVQDTIAELNLLKFIQSNANSKTDFGHYWEILQRSFCNKITRQMSIKTDAFINSVHNTFHYTDVAVDVAFTSSEIRSLRLCLTNVPETLFWNSRIKVNHKPTARATGLSRNSRHKTSSFLAKSVERTQTCSDPGFY
jgi:hypothetical protein